VVSASHLEGQAGSNRLLIWTETLKLIPQNWAFGVGPDHLFYAGIVINDNTAVDKAHNIFLEIAVTMGLFALFAYMAFLFFFLRPGKTDHEFMYFIMIATYLIQGLFNIEVVTVMPLFWIVLGLSLGNKKGLENKS